MPKFSAYMKGGDGSVGPPGASIINGILPSENSLPVPNQNKYAYLIGTSNPKHLWVWDEETNQWKDQGLTASQIGEVTASVTTITWSTTAIPSVQTQFSTSNQIDYFDFDFTLVDGRPAGFGSQSATVQALSPDASPWATITAITTSPDYAKEFNFNFGIPTGKAAGFSTSQYVSISTLDAGQQPIVEITTITTSPETAKEFNFHFGIPEAYPGRTAIDSITTNVKSLSTTINSVSTNLANLIELRNVYHVTGTIGAGNGKTFSTNSNSTYRITNTMRVINCSFGTPTYVGTDVSWTTTVDAIQFSGTFTGTTSVDFDLVECKTMSVS